MRVVYLLALTALAACYDPTYQELACGPSGACPSGYSCAANVCVRDVPIDGAIDVAIVDGPIDGAPAVDATDASAVDARLDGSLVDATIDAVPPCPGGDLTSPTDPTRCFRFRGTAASWAQARDACAAMGGALADVRNAQENVALISIIGTAPSTWLGGTDAAVEGAWLWTDGTPFSFNAWAEGQPNGGITTNCVRFVGNGVATFGPSDWTDQACAMALPSICVHAP